MLNVKLLVHHVTGRVLKVKDLFFSNIATRVTNGVHRTKSTVAFVRR